MEVPLLCFLKIVKASYSYAQRTMASLEYNRTQTKTYLSTRCTPQRYHDTFHTNLLLFWLSALIQENLFKFYENFDKVSPKQAEYHMSKLTHENNVNNSNLVFIL